MRRTPWAGLAVAAVLALGGYAAAPVGGYAAAPVGGYAAAPAAEPPPAGAAEAIDARWQELGGAAGPMGEATASAEGVAGGAVRTFEGGDIYWSSGTGAVEVRWPMRGRYTAAGGPAALGFPTRPAVRAPSGTRSQLFTAARMYYSRDTGVQEVTGPILERFTAAGGARVMGLPTGRATLAGRASSVYQPFTAGRIYHHPTTGTWDLRGDINRRYVAIGGARHWLGLPTGPERWHPAGRQQALQRGSLVRRTATGRVHLEAPYTTRVTGVTADDVPHSYRAGCPVGPASLRRLQLTHYDFAGDVRRGELIVHRSVVADLTAVFRVVHGSRFPVRRMVRVDAYAGDDDRSTAADNTSAFNCRRIAGSSRLSQHAYGTAVDINPVENPYVSGDAVSPPAGRAYTDRADNRPGMLQPWSAVTREFRDRGWDWGGLWSRPDYQHFSRDGG